MDNILVWWWQHLSVHLGDLVALFVLVSWFLYHHYFICVLYFPTHHVKWLLLNLCVQIVDLILLVDLFCLLILACGAIIYLGTFSWLIWNPAELKCAGKTHTTHIGAGKFVLLMWVIGRPIPKYCSNRTFFSFQVANRARGLIALAISRFASQSPLLLDFYKGCSGCASSDHLLRR